jgi:hypothetical protein
MKRKKKPLKNSKRSSGKTKLATKITQDTETGYPDGMTEIF